MQEKVVLTSIGVTELLDLIAASVKKELGVVPPAILPQHELLDRKETAALLRITLPTLREYTRRRIVKGYRLGSCVRYKRSEVMAALRPMDFGPGRRVRLKSLSEK